MTEEIGSYIGQTCEVVVPLGRNSTIAMRAEAQRHAQDVADTKCREVGCVATDVTLIARRPWPGPQQDMELLVYQATATEGLSGE